jgi:hypothetical protein
VSRRLRPRPFTDCVAPDGWSNTVGRKHKNRCWAKWSALTLGAAVRISDMSLATLRPPRGQEYMSKNSPRSASSDTPCKSLRPRAKPLPLSWTSQAADRTPPLDGTTPYALCSINKWRHAPFLSRPVRNADSKLDVRFEFIVCTDNCSSDSENIRGYLPVIPPPLN